MGHVETGVLARRLGGTSSGMHAAGFPYLHRTVAEVGIPGGACIKPDHVSSVPILEGYGTDDCWQFRFIIPGERQ
jgi:hypothetical protein